jgi:hypothetical protein
MSILEERTIAKGDWQLFPNIITTPGCDFVSSLVKSYIEDLRIR